MVFLHSMKTNGRHSLTIESIIIMWLYSRISNQKRKSIDTEEPSHKRESTQSHFDRSTRLWFRTVNNSNLFHILFWLNFVLIYQFFFCVLLLFSPKICQDYFLRRLLLMRKIFGSIMRRICGRKWDRYRAVWIGIEHHSTRSSCRPEIIFSMHTQSFIHSHGWSHARIKPKFLSEYWLVSKQNAACFANFARSFRCVCFNFNTHMIIRSPVRVKTYSQTIYQHVFMLGP